MFGERNGDDIVCVVVISYLFFSCNNNKAIYHLPSPSSHYSSYRRYYSFSLYHFSKNCLNQKVFHFDEKICVLALQTHTHVHMSDSQDTNPYSILNFDFFVCFLKEIKDMMEWKYKKKRNKTHTQTTAKIQ